MTPSPPPARRARSLVFLALVVVAGGLADRIPREPDKAATGMSGAAGMPVAAPAKALSSSWYCAGATATAGGAADGSLVVANPGSQAVTGSVTIVPNTGDPRTVPLTVGAMSRAVIRHRDLLEAPYAAALVELDGGEVVVEHAVDGPLGYSVAPCASSASERWYFAEGSTARDDTMLLALYNPFPEDAIVDLSFATDQGQAAPSAFKGIVVRPGALNVVSVGDHVRRRAFVATTVQSRRGRLVVDRIQLRNGAVKGVTLTLGAPATGPVWHFADGLVADGITERFHLFNPSAEEAQVDIEVVLDEGGAEPFEITVPPRERVTVSVNDEDRIPDGVAHSATVRVLNGVDVVAERSISAGPPAARSGVSDALGIRQSAHRWVLAAGSATETVDEWVVVRNVSGDDATVTVTALASGQPLAVEGLQGVVVRAGGRSAFRLGDHIRRGDLGLLVSSSAPVVVERALYRVGSTGISTVAGIPLR